MKNTFLLSFLCYLLILTFVINSCVESVIDNGTQNEESLKDEQNQETVDVYQIDIYQIYVMNPDGTEIIEITRHARAPSWSPNGQKLVFYSDGGIYDVPGSNEICTINSDGTEITLLTDNNEDDNFPAWSPDGQKIAFVSERDGNRDNCSAEFIAKYVFYSYFILCKAKFEAAR